MSLTNELSFVPWNKEKLVGQKLPLKLKEVGAIRVRLQLTGKRRDLALFSLTIDSMLRVSDLVRISINEIIHGGVVHLGKSEI